MKIFIGLVVSLLIVGLGWWFVVDYLALGKNQFLEDGAVVLERTEEDVSSLTDNQQVDSVTSDQSQKSFLSQLLSKKTENVEYVVDSFVTGLNVPWSIVFTSPQRILVAERPGNIRVVEDGKLLPNSLASFSVSNQSEEGLMGMTLDPDYQTNKYVYICLAYGTKSPIFDKVIRVTDNGTSLTNETIIIDKIPAAEYHAGCRLRFGPDDKLYISTGDARQKDLAQSLDSLAGKILRLNNDGTIPTDNPIKNSPIYSLGHRNPQGFDWHPKSLQLFSTEHGPTGNDGPGGGDELNLIEAGKNYGWPLISHQQKKSGLISPLIEWTPAIAPASGMFYSGDVFPQFANNFFFGMLRGNGIVRVIFDDVDTSKVLSYEKLKSVDVGRVRDVIQGPDGLIYFVSSNKDGRGVVREGDDQIFRLRPKK